MSAAPSPQRSGAPDWPVGPEHSHIALGIDVGGTKVAAGLVDPQGTVLLRRSAPTAADSLAVLDLVLTLADSLLDSARSLHRPVVGTGLSLCELVTPDGQIASDDTIAWRGLPIQALLAERTADAVVEADIRAHALAEARYGAGRGLATFLYINVGTGISSCLVLNGQPYTGVHGNALVLATMPVTVFDEQERKVEFALEAFASGAGLTQRYRRHRADTSRVEEIVADAAKGDPHATQILCSGGEALGSALAWLVNVLD
ncbi:MAG: ROK family protein, partial [Caldilinea sp.]